MTGTAGKVDLAEFEHTLGEIMPTALDMIAAVVEAPGTDWDTYSGTLEVIDKAGPLLPLAILRAAAGIAAIADLSPSEVRALATTSTT